MSIFSGPKLSTTGLELALDFSNMRCHSYSENMYPNSESLSTIFSTKTGYSSTSYSTGGPFNNSFHRITVTDTNNYLFEWGGVVNLVSEVTYTQTWRIRPISNVNVITLMFWSGSGRAWLSDVSLSFTLSPAMVSSSGSGVSGYIEKLSNGWYEVSLTSTATATGTSAISLYGSSSIPIGAVYDISSVQIVERNNPVEYAATTGTAKSSSNTSYALNNSAISATGVGGTIVSRINTVRCLDMNTSGYLTYTLPNAIGKFGVTFMYWGRGTGAPASDYRPIWRLHDTNDATVVVGDNRQTSNAYILFYTKDFALNTYTTKTVQNSATYLLNTWNHFAIRIDSPTSFTTFYNGVSQGATTITTDITSYADLKYLRLNGSSTSYNIHNCYLYSRALSSAEVLQHFNSTKSKFGL